MNNQGKLASLPKNQLGPEINSRSSLADWMVSSENPMFTKATVNRLWQRSWVQSWSVSSVD